MSCKWYGCRTPTPNEYCILHDKAMGKTPVKDKKVTPIKKVSDKEKERKKELKKMYPVFLAQPENEMCQLKLKGCLGKATTVHHVRSRIGEQVFEVNDWLASCIWCNISLENDPEAYKKGLKKSKFHE